MQVLVPTISPGSILAMWKKRLERYVELRDAIMDYLCVPLQFLIFAMRAGLKIVSCR